MNAARSALGIVLPSDFNSAAYDEINAIVGRRATTEKNSHALFVAAWIGLGYRYRAAAEYHERFTELIRRSVGPPPEERFQQDHSLFGCISACLSSLECCCFALYCVGAMVDGNAFPLSSPKHLRVYARDTAEAYNGAFPGDPLTIALRSVVDEKEFQELADYRNALSHRGTPPRMISISLNTQRDHEAFIPANPQSLAADWRLERSLDTKTTGEYLTYVGRSLDRLMKEASQFVKQQL
jgi:hypothetical protein